MAVILSSRYLGELCKEVNTPNTIVELYLDGGTVRLGYHGRNGCSPARILADGTWKADGVAFAVGSDELEPFGVVPALRAVSSFQNKLDTKNGFSTRGQITVTISGRENFRGIVDDEYLRSRRVARKEGFIAPGFTYGDYATTFSGKVTDWNRKGDELTLTISDDLYDASKTVPSENDTNTQYLSYQMMNPADIMKDVLINQLGVDSSVVDTGKFDSERDLWLNNWKFCRVITESKEGNDYLNELQVEANSYLLHDGEKISFKVFSPPLPSDTVEEWTDSAHILMDSFSQKSGYKENFWNRVIVYYDYDESGSDKADSFDSAVIAVDASSQSSWQWSDTSTKVIYSKWIRTLTWTNTMSGLVIYHVSKSNGAGVGSITFNYANKTLQWSPPGDSIGETVNISQDGKFQVYGADATKYIRVLVTNSELPASDINVSVNISGINGAMFATTLATKLLNRYRDPASTVSFDIDLNNIAFDSRFIKPTDIKDITTDEACGKGEGAWTRKRVMLTSVKPDIEKGKVSIEAIETRLLRRYGYISPAGIPDYGSASETQRRYGFIGSFWNKLDGAAEDGFYIW